jgi:hypothetical protein
MDYYKHLDKSPSTRIQLHKRPELILLLRVLSPPFFILRMNLDLAAGSHAGALRLKRCYLLYVKKPLQNGTFARFLRQAQILNLEILNIFLWLKFLSSLNTNRNYHFSKVL